MGHYAFARTSVASTSKEPCAPKTALRSKLQGILRRNNNRMEIANKKCIYFSS
jgi:hypothetical protein